MKRKATAVWQGGLKDGKGIVSTESGVLEKAQYSFSTRFESGKGTNPEELIAAAHAGCFAMALSGQLGTVGLTAQSLEVISDPLWYVYAPDTPLMSLGRPMAAVRPPAP